MGCVKHLWHSEWGGAQAFLERHYYQELCNINDAREFPVYACQGCQGEGWEWVEYDVELNLKHVGWISVC